MIRAIRDQRLRVLLLTIGTMFTSASLAHAQYMSISHYADEYVTEDETVVAYLSAMDNSSGCDHSNYQMDVSGGGPGSSWGNTAYGLSAGGGMTLTEDGDYWAESHLIFQCSCAVGYIDGGGGSVSFPIKKFQAVYQKNHYDVFKEQWIYAQSGCSGDCQGSVMCTSQEANYVYVPGWRVNTGLAILCIAIPPWPRPSATQPECKQQPGIPGLIQDNCNEG